MTIDRKIAHAPQVANLNRALANEIPTCVGCDGCQGLCAALIDTMMVPDIILRRAGSA